MKWDHSVGVNLPGAPFREATREAPAGHPAVVYVTLPLGAGLVMFFGTGLLALAFHWSVRVAYATAGMSVCVVFALLTVMLWSRPLLWTVERIKGTVTAQLERQPEGIRIEVASRDNRQLQYLELPIADPRNLYSFASRLLEGYPLSESEWSGRGKMFSKSQFHDVRDRLIMLQMARWRDAHNPSQGLELTPHGRSTMRAIVERDRPQWEAEPPLLEEQE